MFLVLLFFISHTIQYFQNSGNDNLFQGLSTFTVEMSELRTILNMADQMV